MQKCLLQTTMLQAMDGILVESTNTLGATEVNPKTLEEGKDFIYINTGNPVVAPLMMQ